MSSLEEKENFNLKRLCERINELLKLEEDLNFLFALKKFVGEMQLVKVLQKILNGTWGSCYNQEKEVR